MILYSSCLTGWLSMNLRRALGLRRKEEQNISYNSFTFITFNNILIFRFQVVKFSSYLPVCIPPVCIPVMLLKFHLEHLQLPVTSIFFSRCSRHFLTQPHSLRNPCSAAFLTVSPNFLTLPTNVAIFSSIFSYDG